MSRTESFNNEQIFAGDLDAGEEKTLTFVNNLMHRRQWSSNFLCFAREIFSTCDLQLFQLNSPVTNRSRGFMNVRLLLRLEGTISYRFVRYCSTFLIRSELYKKQYHRKDPVFEPLITHNVGWKAYFIALLRVNHSNDSGQTFECYSLRMSSCFCNGEE